MTDSAIDLTTIDAELSILGAILMAGGANNAQPLLDAVAVAFTDLEASDFSPRLQPIFEVAHRLHRDGGAVDPVTVKAALTDKELKRIGGIEMVVETLMDAMDLVPNAWSLPGYVDALKRQRVDRARAEAIRKAQASMRAGEPSTEWSSMLMADLEAAERRITRPPVTAVGAMAEALRMAEAEYRGEVVAGPDTGITELDSVLGGLRPGGLHIIGGRPGRGKTQLALTIARAALKAEMPVYFASLEMAACDLMGKLASMEARVNSKPSRRTEADREAFYDAAARVSQWPLYLDEAEVVADVERLASRARVLHARHDLGLVVVDYLQLVRPPSSMPRNTPEYARIGAISRALKLLAVSLGVPVVAPCQLGRQADEMNAAAKPPTMNLLRESGNLEQDADTISIIWPSSDGEGVDLHVCKNRYGETAQGREAIPARFMKACGLWTSPDPLT